MPIAARAKLATRLIVLAAAGLVVAGLSGCDATSRSGPSIIPTADPDTRQVTVVGSGEVQGTPDTLNANVSIEFTAPDVTAAMNQTSDRQQAVINALVNSGIDRSDISTTNVSLQPQYGGAGDNPTITGYRASNSIYGQDPQAGHRVAGIGTHRQHGRRRHPHQLRQLLRSRTTRNW